MGGLTELEEKSDEALASEEVRITFQDHGLNAHIPKIHTLILLSLGSLLTLTDFFNLPKKIHLHVIDSHRPWNLGNLFDIDLDDEDDEDAHGKVWIWGDGDEFSENMDQLRKSFEALQFLPQRTRMKTVTLMKNQRRKRRNRKRKMKMKRAMMMLKMKMDGQGNGGERILLRQEGNGDETMIE